MADDDNVTDNVSIWDNAGDKNVTVTTDGSKELLDVLAKIDPSSAFNLQAFNPKLEFDSTGVTLNTSTWTELLSVTGTRGKLDFIACAGSLSTYRVRMTIDTVVVYDIAMSDLSAIGLSNATNVPMWAETADKNFRYHPNIEVDFTTDMKVEAKAVTATPTVEYLIQYREEA